MDSPTPKQPQDEEAIMQAFKQRQGRERLADLLTFISLGIIVVLAWYYTQRGVPAGDLLWLPLSFLGVVIAAAVFTQWNWCCPACGSALAGLSVKIDAWFTPEPLNCPHCQAKLS